MIKKAISILIALTVFTTGLIIPSESVGLQSRIYNAYTDYDINYSDAKNSPWRYMYTIDGGENFILMGKSAYNLGIKWYPKDETSYMTAIGHHNTKMSDEVLILDATSKNNSIAVLAFTAPSSGLYKFTAKVFGNQYPGQKGEHFFIFHESSQIGALPFGDESKVKLEYSLPGALYLEEGENLYFYQKSAGGSHHSAFINVVVDGPMQNYDGIILDFRKDNNQKDPPDSTQYNFTNLTLSVGENISHMNFSWHNSRDKGFGMVQVAKKEDMVEDNFPAHLANTHFGELSVPSSGIYKNEVTADGLLENTEYVYRISSKDANVWSNTYTFKTGSKNDFGFIILGDPKIGGGESLETDAHAWNNIWESSTEYFNKANFIYSPGNLVSLASSAEQYNSLLSPQLMKNVPFVSAIGTSDVGSTHRKHYFNFPNVTENAQTLSGSNYFFSYGDALFIVLNTNIVNEFEHRETLRNAINSHADAKWKIVLMHHSLYSSGYWYAHNGFTIGIREKLAPLMDEFAIDVVFNGRDHAYSRSHYIKHNEVISDQFISSEGNPVYPKGTVYVTAGSSTGSTYFDLTDEENPFVAEQNQPLKPTFITVDITADEFIVKTILDDTKAVIDEFTIQKGVFNAKDLSEYVNKAKDYANPGVSTLLWKEFIDAINIAQSVSLKTDEDKSVYNLAFKLLKEKWDNIIESIVNKAELENMTRNARILFSNSSEGDEPGQFPVGSKDQLLMVIQKSEDLLKSSMVSQMDIDQMLIELSSAVSIFERQRIKLREITAQSIIYRAFDDFDELKSDGTPWQYLFTFGEGVYEPLPEFDLGGWRAIPGVVWAGIAKNPEVPETIEFNTGHSGDHIGVLAFVAPENGVYTINEFEVKSNMWQQFAEGFYVFFENSLINESIFGDNIDDVITIPEYTIEMHQGEKIYFYVTRQTSSVSAYADIVIERLIFEESKDSIDSVNWIAGIFFSVILIILILMGIHIIKRKKKA